MINTDIINVKAYPKPKKEGSGGNSNITYSINGSDIGSNLKLKSLQANRIMSEYIEANNIKSGSGDFVYLVASDGTISSLRGDNLEYNAGRIGDLDSDNITTNKLDVNDTATITNIFNNYMNSKEIVTDYLTVNKAAHFFDVVVDKIRSVGGTIINTATSCVIDYVQPISSAGTISAYRCYWKQTNNENEYVSNDWMVGDQAISQNCNLVAGINHNTSNHYYWRLVKGTSNDDTSHGPTYVNFDTGQVSWGNYNETTQEYTAPDYKIGFKGQGFSGFEYDNGLEDELSVIVTDWNISSQTVGDWDATNEVLTVRDTLHGIQLIPNNFTQIIDGVEHERYPNVRKGHFTFRTAQPTKLNVMILFDNDTIEYHSNTGAKTNYDINIINANNALVNMIVITSDVVDVWHACHWIDLGNLQGEYDVPAGEFATEVAGWDNVPAKGDNIAQLGYRYGNNPTEDEISRASAIIIAAYKTPDSGGIINNKTIAPIKPSSYAQYHGITDFNLFTHRGTYMDATGAYVKGNLVTESGTSVTVDDLLEIAGTQGPQGPQGYQGSGGIGPQGPQGSQGYNGSDGEYFELVPLRETFEVQLNAEQVGNEAYQNIKGVIYTDLIYAVAHVVGNTVTYLNASQIQAYKLQLTSDNVRGLNGPQLTTYVKAYITGRTASDGTYNAIRYQHNNYLEYITGQPSAEDVNNIYYLHTSSTASDRNYIPTAMSVSLVKKSDNKTKDITKVSLEFKPSHIFSVTDSALNSIYQGLSGSRAGWSTTGFSLLKQQWDLINLSVNNIRTFEFGQEYIDNTKNVNGTGDEQYAFYRTASKTVPKVPTDDITEARDRVNDQWTLNTRLQPTNNCQYMYITRRKREFSVTDTDGNPFGAWSLWCTPKLYWIYGNEIGTTINSAQLNIEADKIESRVFENIKGGGVNLIMNGNFSKLSSGSPVYWDTYQNPPYRYIYTDNTDHNWMYVQSNDEYQGYAQAHYNDYNIRIDGGQTYTISFRAYSPTTAYISITFHFWNDTNDWSLYAGNEIPQFTKQFTIDNKDTLYSCTFVAKQANHVHSGNNLYVKNNNGTYIDTGKPAQGFRFIIGSGVDEHGRPSNSQAFYITDIMLAPGTIAQSWEPSLQETESQTQSLISQSADNIKLEVKNGLNSTGINIDTNKITLNANNTIINGDLDLRGNFTSENTTSKNKITIDASSGGFTMYGPTHVDDHGDPYSDALQGKLLEASFDTDADSNARSGKLVISNSYTSGTPTTYISLAAGTDGGVEVTAGASTNKLRFNSNQCSHTDSNNNTVNTDWQTLIGKGHRIGSYTSGGTIQAHEDMIVATLPSVGNLTLPVCAFSKQIIIFNNGSYNLNVYAPNSGSIIGKGTSANYTTINQKHCATLVQTYGNSNNWYIINYT